MHCYLRSALREELSVFDPDVVHVSAGILAGLADDLDGRPSVLAALDAAHLNIEAKMQLARGPRRWLLDREVRRVRRFEAGQYGRFGCVIVVSEQDREALAGQARSEAKRGGDSPRSRLRCIRPRRRVTGGQGARIVFTGVMRYPPNVSAAECLAQKVMPRVRAAWPGARLCIVGRDPAERVRALALADEVDVVGEVPDLGP
jgi:Glycosyl transferases group 1